MQSKFHQSFLKTEEVSACPAASMYPEDLLPPAPALIPMSLPPLVPLQCVLPNLNSISFDAATAWSSDLPAPVNLSYRDSGRPVYGPWATLPLFQFPFSLVRNSLIVVRYSI